MKTWYIAKTDRERIDERQRDEGGYRYCTNCVGSTAEKISPMVETSEEVSYAKFVKNVNKDDFLEFQRDAKYSTGREKGGLRIKDDYAVSYYRGVYDGYPAYYMDHSSIEHVYIADEKLKDRGFGPKEEQDKYRGTHEAPSGAEGEATAPVGRKLMETDQVKEG